MDTLESRLWREERELTVLMASRLSWSVRRSLFLFREKMERLPEDCLDLSAADIVSKGYQGSTYVIDEKAKRGWLEAAGILDKGRASRGRTMEDGRGKFGPAELPSRSWRRWPDVGSRGHAARAVRGVLKSAGNGAGRGRLKNRGLAGSGRRTEATR